MRSETSTSAATLGRGHLPFRLEEQKDRHQAVGPHRVILTCETGHMVTGSGAHPGPMAAKQNTGTQTDPRALFASALATGAEVITGVTEDQLDRPTPCADFDVRTLANHLLHAPAAIASLGRGDSYTDDPPDLPVDQWRQEWDASAAAVREVWSDDALLGTTISLPWAELTGAEVLAQFTGEVVVHTWDLAQATGQWAEWKPEVLEASLEAWRAGLPAEGREAFAAFGEVVPVVEDAPLIDQIVAWTGRRP